MRENSPIRAPNPSEAAGDLLGPESINQQKFDKIR